jgi:hypothetical protein
MEKRKLFTLTGYELRPLDCPDGTYITNLGVQISLQKTQNLLFLLSGFRLHATKRRDNSSCYLQVPLYQRKRDMHVIRVMSLQLEWCGEGKIWQHCNWTCWCSGKTAKLYFRDDWFDSLLRDRIFWNLQSLQTSDRINASIRSWLLSSKSFFNLIFSNHLIIRRCTVTNTDIIVKKTTRNIIRRCRHHWPPPLPTSIPQSSVVLCSQWLTVWLSTKRKPNWIWDSQSEAMKCTDFSEVTPCSPVEAYRRFG